MSDSGLQAWVDESILIRSSDEGVYILAASVAGGAIESTREALRALRHRKRPRLHWRDEEESDRLKIIRTISTMDVLHFVVVHERIDPRRQERARRKCLERLLFVLAEMNVEQVSLESRADVLNRRDLRLVDASRSAGLAGSMTVQFAKPLDEPMLWLPDAVAGAIGAQHRDPQSPYRELLRHALDESEL